MGDVYLNGRKATDYEVAAIERGRRCEHERDLALLAGLLTGEPPPLHAGRAVADLPVLK